MKKLLKLLIIPLFLTLGYCILLAYPYFFSKISRYDSLGFLSAVEEKSVNLTKSLSKERQTDRLDNHLLKGEKISGKIKASENNFGILLFRFAKLSGKVSDTVFFRIKKEGEGKWYYEHVYKADQFQDNQYFTFGFPNITDAKNNVYFFEIESLAGTYKNGIGVSPNEPIIALVYKYSKNDLKDHKILFSLIGKKFVYALSNMNFLQNWQLLATFILPLLLIFFINKKKIRFMDTVRFLPKLKKTHRKVLKAIINEMKSNYLSLEKKTVIFSKKTIHRCTSTRFYLLFFNTNTKKKAAIGLLIFLLAFTYRFSSSLVDRSGMTLFYAGLGGNGDYDQFIRTATCAITSFCSAILGQNFLFESSILGMFYKIFGFTEALKVYLFFMIILSSIVSTLPYLLLSKKNRISLGGVFGSLFLATSDFLTNVSLNFPPDNSSMFTFSMFFIVYFLTLQKGTIRWLLFFGLMGLIDGLNKALFLINDLVAFALFAPVFFYEKTKPAKDRFTSGKKKIASLFRKKNIRILLLSLLPLVVFILIYSAWEYFVYIKFSAPYFLRGLLLSRGNSYVAYTSFSDNALTSSLLMQLFYLSISLMVMLKRLIEYTNLGINFLAPIFIGLLFFTFIIIPRSNKKFPVWKFIFQIIFSVVVIILLTLIKNNYFNIHKIFEGEYIFISWTDQIYTGIFLISQIIILFIINFRYTALKLSLPILPYVIMLIILTKNSPFPRISTQVVAWLFILYAYLIDWIVININQYSKRRVRIILESLILVLFICMYVFPKMVTMVTQLNSGFVLSQNEVRYLRWVEGNVPANAVILAGGKSNLVTVAENIRRPIIFSTLWSAAVLIKPNKIPGISPTDFTIISELKNKDNFKRNKYVILEDDIYIWRDRVTGVADNVFATTSNTLLHGDNYSIKVYKFNPTLKKAIYELNLRDTSVN